MIYSLEERKIGKFFDEDLYEKTIMLSDFVKEQQYNQMSYEDESGNIKNIIDLCGIIVDSDVIYPLIKFMVSNTTSEISYFMINGTNKTDEDNACLFIDTRNIDLTNVTDGFVKIQYTK